MSLVSIGEERLWEIARQTWVGVEEIEAVFRLQCGNLMDWSS